MWHPWRALRTLGHVTLHWVDRDHPLGEVSFGLQTVTLATGMTQAERRCVLTHELVHLERGPAPVGHEIAEERAVERESAKRLIGIRALGEALAWAHDLDEAADELWTDRVTLDARLEHLHPAERAYLRRRLESDGHGSVGGGEHDADHDRDLGVRAD